jgi:hypothetical protein
VRRRSPMVSGGPTAEVAAICHSITSSAMARSPGGKLRPNALAVLRLITNSNLGDAPHAKADEDQYRLPSRVGSFVTSAIGRKGSVPGLGSLRKIRCVHGPFVRAGVLEHHDAIGPAILAQAFPVDPMTGNARGIDRPFLGAYVFEQYRTGCKTLFAVAAFCGRPAFPFASLTAVF